MKKNLLVLCLAHCFLNVSYSQVPATAYAKGNSMLSAGYGVVNIWTLFLKNAFSYPPNTYKVGSTGPFALTYEYAFSKRISGGIALGHSVVTGRFNGFGFKFTEKLNAFTALARSNYHFFLKGRKFDPYIGAGLGFFKFRYTNDTPGIINSKVPGSFGYSGQAGTHYYFNSHLGAYAELGYVGAGGSLGELGVTVKFH
jgi:outer membrane protein W